MVVTASLHKGLLPRIPSKFLGNQNSPSQIIPFRQDGKQEENQLTTTNPGDNPWNKVREPAIDESSTIGSASSRSLRRLAGNSILPSL
jgi:hypothetical protein